MNRTAAFRKSLLTWYRANKRDLPWRNTTDPYPIWISEIMLQQTRVAAVIPYYQRFLDRFPTPQSLAAAPGPEVLSLWAGLGYYSRARNLQQAARQIAAQGGFPKSYEAIRALPGIGDYTAAAIASISFELPHAVLDGNVMRVLARFDNDPGDISSSKTRQRLQQRAQQLLDTRHPALFNQAIMELGATLCLPKQPQCLLCPVQSQCQAFAAATQHQLPIKLRKTKPIQIDRTLLIVEKNGSILMWQRDDDSSKLQGFWELPEPHHLPDAKIGPSGGKFRHSITNHQYLFSVSIASISHKPKGFSFIPRNGSPQTPFSTTTRKALACLKSEEKVVP